MRYIKAIAGAIAVSSLLLSLSLAVPDRYSRYDITRSPGPEAADVLSLSTSKIWGGVILQATGRFVGGNGEVIELGKVEISHFNQDFNRLYLKYAENLYNIEIGADILVRTVQWINNSGTGLYTAYELSDEDVRRNGLSEDVYGNYIATEFAGSPIEEVAKYIDFTDLETSFKGQAELILKYNKGLKRGSGGEDMDWVVSDLDANFRFFLEGSKVSISGTLFKYYRTRVVDSDSTNRIYVREISEIISKASLFLLLSHEGSAQYHEDVVKFWQLVALLRTIRAENPSSWSDFVNKLVDSI